MDSESNLERARRLIGKEFNLKPPSMEISMGDINFLNEEHRERFTKYCTMAHIHNSDRESGIIGHFSGFVFIFMCQVNINKLLFLYLLDGNYLKYYLETALLLWYNTRKKCYRI